MKKQGFTLIELLAVIVILAIIALIATPLILNVIDDAKKGAFKNTAYGIIEAGELGFAQDIMGGSTEEVVFTYTSGVESSSVSGKTLNYNGEKPQSGTVTINSAGQVALAIYDGKFCAEKDFNEIEVAVVATSEAGCVIGAGDNPQNPDPQPDPVYTVGNYTSTEITTMVDTQSYIPIATAAELNNIKSATASTFGTGTDWEASYTAGLDKKYILLSNIDLSSYATGEGWVPIGDGSTPFSGIFDGNGFTISNITVTRPTTDYQGLFGVVSGATADVSDLTLTNVTVEGMQFVGALASRVLNGAHISNVDVTSGTITGHMASTGGFVGQSYGASNVIDDCHTAANVNATETTENMMWAGGFTGLNSGGTISNSSATGTVVSDARETGGFAGENAAGGTITNSYATGNVSSANLNLGGFIGANRGGTISSSMATGNVTATTQWAEWVGGFAGMNHSNYGSPIGVIENSYATGNVTASISGIEAVGGFTGYNLGGSTLTNCYSKGAVNGAAYVGGLVGYDRYTDDGTNIGGAVTSSYWDTQTSGLSSSTGGTGKTTVQMKTQSTFTGWDFTNVWGIDSGINNGYPYLRALQ